MSSITKQSNVALWKGFENEVAEYKRGLNVLNLGPFKNGSKLCCQWFGMFDDKIMTLFGGGRSCPVRLFIGQRDFLVISNKPLVEVTGLSIRGYLA